MEKVTQHISLFQFFKSFPDEQSANDFFEQARWAGGVRCPHCDKKETVKAVANKKPQPYHCKECRKYFSVKVGSVMESSHIPLRVWLMSIYLMTVARKGISSCQLARELKVQQKTAYFLQARIREAWKTNDFMLAGTVEIDESYFGGKEKNKHKNKQIDNAQGRSVKGKTPVAGVLQRGGELRAKQLPDTRGYNLRPFVIENVAFGATLKTDEYGGYNGLNRVFKHDRVAHNEGQYVDGDTHTNGMEGFWAILKRGIYGIYHHVNKLIHG